MTFGVRMNKNQRHEYIVRRARELAATGKYLNYTVIEAVLTSEGLPGARHVLDSVWLRESKAGRRKRVIILLDPSSTPSTRSDATQRTFSAATWPAVDWHTIR